jgi:transposase InsO family protein
MIRSQRLMNASVAFSRSARWAELRFAIVGPLLAAPPAHGQLGAALAELAAKRWCHPISGEAIQFSAATLERWFYVARNSPDDPLGALRAHRRSDAGQSRQLSAALIQALHTQYTQHPQWSYRLHYDNLAARVSQEPALAPLPSYATVRRYMKAQGWVKQRRLARHPSPGQQAAAERLAQREVRSFEAEYVGALWHLDFHQCSRAVLSAQGHWIKPCLLGVLDDYSRLACHVQWYLGETAETLVHGLSQAIQKRGLPRALMTDNGAAMLADEVRQGLQRLSIIHELTLPYSPYQNAKQEVFWASVEGRLMAMLDGVEALTLAQLNEATQAWAEQEYHRRVHSELGCTPLARYLQGAQVMRPSPDSEPLRQAFRQQVSRRQRRSDGTVSVLGRRFELPSRYRQLEQPVVRYARWDLRGIDLIDPHSDQVLCTLYPLDKTANAEGQRRALAPLSRSPDADPIPPDEPAPLLQQLLADYAASGLPPAYLPSAAEVSDE